MDQVGAQAVTSGAEIVKEESLLLVQIGVKRSIVAK